MRIQYDSDLVLLMSKVKILCHHCTFQCKFLHFTVGVEGDPEQLNEGSLSVLSKLTCLVDLFVKITPTLLCGGSGFLVTNAFMTLFHLKVWEMEVPSLYQLG